MRKIFGYISITALLFACSADPELGPIITIDSAEIGAFPRLLELTSGEYDLANLSTSAYVHELDFRSENGGRNVTEYRIFVSHTDNDDSNGDQSVSEELYRSFTQSDFVENSSTGNLGLTLNFPFTEIASDLGIDINDVSPGDFFSFRSEVTLDDGRVFAQSNTNPTINGPAFGALFDWRVNATCPLPDDLFVGDYALTYDNVAGGFDESLVEETVTLGLVPGSTTQRVFNATLLDAFGGFPVTPAIEFVCDVVNLLPEDSGVSCGGPNIFLNPAAVALSADITDDSVILVDYIEDGGACGYSATRTMRLTKL